MKKSLLLASALSLTASAFPVPEEELVAVFGTHGPSAVLTYHDQFNTKGDLILDLNFRTNADKVVKYSFKGNYKFPLAKYYKEVAHTDRGFVSEIQVKNWNELDKKNVEFEVEFENAGKVFYAEDCGKKTNCNTFKLEKIGES